MLFAIVDMENLIKLLIKNYFQNQNQQKYI